MYRKNVQQQKSDGYEAIPQEEPDNVESDSISGFQFEEPAPKTPWGTIIFAGFLFFVGTICLTFSGIIFLGYLSEKYDDRAWPAFIIGCIMFIPGAYYVIVTMCVLLKFPGYSYDDIPQFNY